MNREVELALRKQRLQLRSAALRGELAGHAAAFVPVLAAGDKLHDSVRWLRRHPEVAIAAGVALLVARPRAMFRWARRGAVVWQTWSRARTWFEERRRAR